jgi:hypothetical protein
VRQIRDDLSADEGLDVRAPSFFGELVAAARRLGAVLLNVTAQLPQMHA